MNAYTIMGAVGVIACLVVVILLGKRQQEPTRQTVIFSLLAFAGMIIGGHLLYFIVGLPDFITRVAPMIQSFGEFFEQFYYAASGLVFYGGLFGALLCVYIFSKTSHFWPRHILNIMVPGFMAFHICGRIGCTLTGCCYGIEYHGPGAITYSASHITPGMNDDLADFSRFPVQLLEALLELILLVIVLIIYIKKEDSISVTRIYLLSYAVIRFCDEFLRGDKIRGIWGPFSTSQWISLIVIACVIIYTILERSRLKKAAA